MQTKIEPINLGLYHIYCEVDQDCLFDLKIHATFYGIKVIMEKVAAQLLSAVNVLLASVNLFQPLY